VSDSFNSGSPASRSQHPIVTASSLRSDDHNGDENEPTPAPRADTACARRTA